MDARAPRLTNFPVKNRKPARVLDDIEIVQFSSDAIFRRARQEWLRDIMRQGDARSFAVCFALSSYMSFRNGGTAWTDQARLAADLGWATKTVWRAIQDAVANGWLRSQRRANNTSIYKMSYSRSRRETIDLEYTGRIKDFEIDAARRRIAREANGSDRFDGTIQTDLSERNGQECPNGSDRFDRLSSEISSEADPDRPSSERLGEGEQDMASGSEQKKALLDDVISALGRGDIAEGQRIADGLPPARLDWIVSLVDEEGMVGAHQAIVEARKSASPRR
ncbi:hypothetical protein [uncultured Bosea sp.]|uniref:hypothetical protein n=1 Tax=uncultured Bosea sp. TaxID=211457 RepID=UPI00263BBDDB|nr:hypothetical protein [uncultured Bosea sp.]